MSALGWLLAVSLAADFSIYAGGVVHLYIHEACTLVAGVLGLVIAFRRRSLIPASRGSWIPLVLLILIAVNTVLLGAFQYHNVPEAMRKLFWFEHGDALRILGEIAVWVWAFGQLDPPLEDAWRIFDISLWGGAVMVALGAAYWLLQQEAHATTTPFDLAVMVGMPLSVVAGLRNGWRRWNLLRLAIYSAGVLFLYSRTAIIVGALTTLVVLAAARRWRVISKPVLTIAGAWVVVIAITLLTSLYKPSQAIASIPPPPAAAGTTASGSSALLTFLRLASLGDSQIAGYTLPSRLVIWRDALSIFRRSPLVGVGYHDYFLYSKVTEIKTGSNLDPPDLFSSRIKAAHNDYLSMLSEGGLAGLLLYLGFWLLLLITAARLWLRERAERVRHAFTLGFLASLAIVSFFGEILIPRSPSWIAPTVIYWLVIALLLIEADRRYKWLSWPPR